MRYVKPEVFLIAEPNLDTGVIAEYLDAVGGETWIDRMEPLVDRGEVSHSEALIEFAGKLCYRAWAPELNANVKRVRDDNAAYLANIVQSLHGSVTEHAQYTFIFHNVSRVFTHELVRHRAGTAFSQESMRYVRLTDIPFWMPEWAHNDREFMDRAESLLGQMEEFQVWMADHFHLDDDGVPFSEKKAKTSFMRRFAPDGVATGIVFSANVRALRHILQLRTDLSAEEEIRLVFDEVGHIMKAKLPSMFADFNRDDDGQWIPEHRKI